MATTVLEDVVENAGLTGITGQLVYASCHTSAPATSSNESSAARQAVTWGTASSGSISSSGTLHFTGGAANGAIGAVGFWSAATGGTFLGSIAAPASTTFNAEGKIDLTSISF